MSAGRFLCCVHEEWQGLAMEVPLPGVLAARQPWRLDSRGPAYGQHIRQLSDLYPFNLAIVQMMHVVHNG
eukprot:COSAG02_NODE_83_length_39665_cov_25.213719_18_plen_70_part_00